MTNLLKAPTAPVELLPTPFLEVLEAMRMDIRFNVRSSRREWRFADVETGDWRAWQQSERELESWIRKYLTGFGWLFREGEKPDGTPRVVALNRERFEEVAQAVCWIRRVDPLLAWLDELPAWDGEERIDGLLARCFGVADEADPDLAAWASRFPLIGAVERARTPGAKIDEVPVLVSAEQGIGKSTLIEHLLPPDLDLFSTISFALDEGRRIERSRGKAILEISEMGGSVGRKSTLEEIKEYISRLDDDWRLAYRPDPVKMPRRFVMIGTTNRLDSLPNDPSGNRRFVPIDLVEARMDYADLTALLADEREQLWAEANARHADGARAYLPPWLKASAAAAAEGHRYVSASAIEDAIGSLGDRPMSFAQVKHALAALDVAEGELRRDSAISAALTAAGWRRDKAGRPRLWRPPDGWGDRPFDEGEPGPEGEQTDFTAGIDDFDYYELEQRAKSIDDTP